MNMRDICKNAARVLFLLASLILVVAFVELAANLLDFSVIFKAYSAGRLIEMSAALLVFVITVLLLEIRDALRDQGAG